ncbi:MAG: RNA 2'-phosphotransferase [Planctomycetota bacterium]
MRISKFLSYVLRHRPDTVGIELDEGGWVDVDVLLAAARDHEPELTRGRLEEVVRSSDKQRFVLSDDGRRIRANQGHSVDVDLGLQPIEPPEQLFHGTAERFVDSIFTNGLERRSRHHVHLSADVEVARAVGQRHGRVAILRVASGAMQRDGLAFCRSDNGVWLTAHVAPRYLTRLPTGDPERA